MLDLVRFDCEKNIQDENPRMNVRLLGAQFFETDSVDKARARIGSAKFLHLTTYESDVGLAHLASQNGCAFVFASADLLNLPPAAAAARMSRMRRLARDCQKMGAPVRVCSLAKNKMELREAHELYAFGLELGMEKGMLGAMLKNAQGKETKSTPANPDRDEP